MYERPAKLEQVALTFEESHIELDFIFTAMIILNGGRAQLPDLARLSCNQPTS